MQRDKKALADGYSKGFRALETLSILAFVALAALLAARLAPLLERHWAILGISVLVGWVAADLVSGLVHWGCDTWGSVDFPVLGQTLIRVFREHHVDEKAITRHDLIETNGMNCMVSLPVMIGAAFISLESAWGVFATSFCLSLTLWAMLTNQIHKWSHEDAPPAWVRSLQRSRLILPPEHHRVHHTPPFERYYCITTGWLNPLLTRTQFFRRAEALVTAITGAIPRRDDIGLEAALEIAPGSEVRAESHAGSTPENLTGA